jgi:hypothetical protein
MSNYTELQNQFVEWAQSLIIMQYRMSSKNQAFVALLCDIIFANALLFQVRDECMDVENSGGTQLDNVGDWVGANRFTDYVDIEAQYFAYPTYEQIKNGYESNQYGFSTYANYDTLDGGMYVWNIDSGATGQISYLSDKEFRRLIKIKIIQNSIKMTRGNIDNAVWSWSQGNIYTTWDTMQLTYTCTNKKWNKILTVANDKGYLPRPSATAITIVTAT